VDDTSKLFMKKNIEIRYNLCAKLSPALLTLVFVSIASLGIPVLQLQAQVAVVGNAGVPKNTVITTVTVGQNPDCVVISPDSQTVYVANSNSPGSISVIDVASKYTVEATVNISNNVMFLALSLDGKTLYVSESPSSSGPGVVEVYDVTTPGSPTLTTTLTAGHYPQSMTVSPDGKELYVASGEGGLLRARENASNVAARPPGVVYVFDTATNKRMNKIVCNGFPFQVLFTDNGKQVDVLNEAGTGFIQFIKTASGTVSPSTRAGGRIFHPAGMVSDANGTTLYFADGQDYVTVCNATNGALKKTFLAVSNVFNAVFFGQPALTLNGIYLYLPYAGGGGMLKAANLSGGGPGNSVAMIDVSTGKIVGSLITVGNDPVWAQVSPDGNTLYVCNASDGTVSVIDIRPK